MSDTEDSESPYTKEEEQMVAEIEAGPMKAELKFLDRKTSDKGKTYYTETKDEITPEQNNWWEKYAMCLTRHMSDDGKKVLRTSLQINSEHLKDLLRTEVQNYPGVSFSTKRISIEAPYHVLFHYRANFVKAAQNQEPGTEAAHHYKLLLDFIEEKFGDEVAQHANLTEQGLMSYDILWTIFKPGQMFFSSMYGQTRAFLLESYQYSNGNKPGLYLSCSYIDYDGEDFGTRDTTQRIPPYAGTVSISALEAVPQDLHRDKKSIRETLLTRGTLFRRYAGMNFMHCSGVALDLEDPCNGIKRVNVDGRIVVDCKTFHRLNPDQEFGVARLSKSSSIAREQKRFDSDGSTKTALAILTDDQLVMASGLVRGFSFGEKRWLDFYVERLSPIQWNEKCFDQLVLADSHKNIVRALVSDHMSSTDTFDDIVEGKGKGLVLVLHGPPGVGKTLTAECVAEYTRRPLYIVSSGDLGTDSQDLDERLSRILDMAQTWRVVLLIDEADVFLEERSQHDLERNALVSIFLRVLEYYQGIMFLTTNRVDTFDDAFKSRIHVPLKYSDLTLASRKQIWINFLSKIDTGVAIDDSGYNALSEANLNGRQIKNVIRTAKSLAHYDKKKLDLDMLQQVIKIQLEFEADLESTSGKALATKSSLVNGTNGVNGVH